MRSKSSSSLHLIIITTWNWNGTQQQTPFPPPHQSQYNTNPPTKPFLLRISNTLLITRVSSVLLWGSVDTCANGCYMYVSWMVVGRGQKKEYGRSNFGQQPLFIKGFFLPLVSIFSLAQNNRRTNERTSSAKGYNTYCYVQ